MFALALLASVAAGARTPSQATLRSLYASLEKTDVVVEGASAPTRTIYVFLDPNCWYCHLTWKALQPYERNGLQVRWVPVAYQKETSLGRAAAIMRSGDRVGALRENETAYREESYDGGIAPAKSIPRALAESVKANTALMQRFGAPGTPAIVWRDGAGTVRVKLGKPTPSELPEITGQPGRPSS